MKVYHRDELRPNDVLLGRGRPIQTWCGNVRFRSMAAACAVGYDAASKNSEKAQVAAQLVRSIKEGGGGGVEGEKGMENIDGLDNDDPGRFLRPLTKDEVESLGREHDAEYKFAELWTDADEGRILEKIKQLFRHCRQADKKNEKNKEGEETKKKKKRGLAASAEPDNTAMMTSGPILAAASADGCLDGLSQLDVDANIALKPLADIVPMKLGGPTEYETGESSSSSSSSAIFGQTIHNNDDCEQGIALGAAAATLGEQEINGGGLPEHTWEPGNDPLMARLLHGLDLSQGVLDTGPAIDPCPLSASRPAVAAESAASFVEGSPDQHIARDVRTSHASTANEAKNNGAEISDTDRSLLLKNNVSIALGAVSSLVNAHRTAAGHDEDKIQNDLKSLGVVLFHFFTGVAVPEVTPPKNGSGNQPEEQKCKRAEIVSTQPTPSDILIDSGLPTSICTLILSLLEATDYSATERYISSADVEEDLLRMTSNPNRYLFDPPSDILDLTSDRLYGRNHQWNRIKACFDSVIVRQEQRRGLVLLTGSAGSGKTSLVEKLRAPLAEQRGMFLSVKFDSQGSEQPISKIFRAIEEYCQVLLQGDPTLLAEVRLAVKEALGSEGAVLNDLIPSLVIVVGGCASTGFGIEQKETYNLIVHCLCKLVRALSGPTHPIIWLLDDLQWSDSASLDIIHKLICDEDTQSTLFVGCFRGDEVAEEHVLNRYLGGIIQSAPYSETISVGNLNKESVNALLSDLLHLTPRLTRPLAGLLFTKTRGNPMFLRQLIRSLGDEGLLQYSARSRRWVWDIEAIGATSVADNTVDLIVSMMKGYGTEICRLLQTAACLGPSFDAATIKLSYFGLSSSSGSVGSEVQGHLAVMVSDGLIISKGSTYKFSHDQIWEAAYSLTPPSEREAMHISIGRQILRSVSEDNRDSFLFTIVDQLNRGIDIINDHREQLEVAGLNLKAGEKALSAYSFLQASIYLLQGSALIKPEDWQSCHYDLCLQLYTACAEVQYAQGNNDGAIISLNPVLINGKSLDDKLRAYHTLLLATVVQMDFPAVIEHSLFVLEQLGETFPDTANQSLIKNELDIAQALFESTRIDDILSMPTSTDARIIAAIRIFSIVGRAAFFANPNLMLWAELRMVQISMSEGLTPESSYAFAGLSFALDGLGNHEMATYCANVALQLLTKFDGKYSMIVVTLLNASILPYTQPFQSCLDSLRHAHSIACSVGDQQWASTSGNMIAQTFFSAPERGKTLDDVENEISLLCGRKKNESKHSHMYLQVVLNLKSVSTSDIDPTVLTGEAMDQDEAIAIAKEKQLRPDLRKIYFCQTYVLYLFRRYDEAAGKVDVLREVASAAKFCSTVHFILETFYVGLVAAAMLSHHSYLSNGDANKWRILADGSLGKLKEWTEIGCEWNFQHKYDLLRAEIAVADSEVDTAASAYDAAITGASEHCYINEQALACERAGLFNLEQGKMKEGREYLTKAKELYRDWGAARKSVDLSHLLQTRCSYLACSDSWL